MTSASELFHSRRSRFGRGTTELGLESSTIDGISHHHPHSNRRHQHHYSHNNRRDRHVLDGCDPPPRRPPHGRHSISRLLHLEHDSVRSDQGGTQSPSGSIINSEEFRNIRSRRRSTGNDRLPGAVLLARERLLERLRGVSISGNRQISRTSPIVHQDDFSYGGNSSFIEPDDREIETTADWLDELMADSMSQVGRLLPSEATRKSPPGLPQEALDCLHVEIFDVVERSDDGEEMSSASRECSICLESFEEGEKLICLPCRHRFHSCCLIPWVRTCGVCPNCRTSIAVTGL